MLAKIVAFIVTGSGSMLGEAVHSLADVLNQALLYFGVRRADREPDDLYRRGYGREQFVWSLVSAVGIFFLGCGVTLYHGGSMLFHPHATATGSKELMIGIVVLLFSLLVEGWVLIVAYREARGKAGDTPIIEYLKDRGDPALIAVLLEDSAACLGVCFALFGIGMSVWTGSSLWDAIGTILIAFLLGLIAVWLVMLNARLLVGRGLHLEDIERVDQTIRKNDFVEEVDRLHSEAIGAGRFELHLDLDLDEDALVKQVEIDLPDAYQKINNEEEFIQFCHSYGAESMRLVYRTIDQIEKDIRAEVGGVDYIDIEPS